ncbi:DUF302 domain-containing protein [Lacisediminihabitans changchengi]|uniref:DUF302 domain-containing protein n=1 Tax=Lacisediminihabitans changchengi TaxID=2787634 RepID=A0A934SLF3_9MICO|nr:DUF302 domain-containing protein [Lacisediminihabitans changchengi]MBK4348786.1 DUF302 domain-containing protein [Lacisediminihabitans changchengi]
MREVQTPMSVAEAVTAITDILRQKGITIFGQYDHAANARSVNLALAEETVIVFGAPAVGTTLMQENPDIGYELPSRLLIRDDHGTTLLTYRDPVALGASYGISPSTLPLQHLSQLFDALIAAVEIRT